MKKQRKQKQYQYFSAFFEIELYEMMKKYENRKNIIEKCTNH